MNPPAQGATMIQLDTNLRAARMMEAGRVTVTFTSPSGQHITLTAKARAPQRNGRWSACPLADAKVVFIEVPGASDEWADKVGKITRARGFVADRNADPARTWCAGQLLRFLAGQPLATGLVAQEEERCGKCGRALTDPVSIARGIGPECYGQMTGSEHQHKVSPKHDSLDGAVQAAEIARDHAAVVEHEAAQERKGDGLDAKGVPLGYGDWRARAKVAKAQLGNTRKVYPSYTEQMNVLPGTTWEDIFRPAAEAKGITL